MRFHPSIVRARPQGGSMALRTSLRTKRNSRHGLWGLHRRQLVSPGGSCAGVVDQLVDQQRHQEFAVEPGAGAVVVVLGQMAEPGERLEAPEDRLDLPAQAVPFENLAGAEGLLAEGGEERLSDILCK